MRGRITGCERARTQSNLQSITVDVPKIDSTLWSEDEFDNGDRAVQMKRVELILQRSDEGLIRIPVNALTVTLMTAKPHNRRAYHPPFVIGRLFINPFQNIYSKQTAAQFILKYSGF